MEGVVTEKDAAAIADAFSPEVLVFVLRYADEAVARGEHPTFLGALSAYYAAQ